ncbi:MAG: DUF268 domain-containing protein [Caldilineaceae bacterium]|nr:DUF268 domain-containing protein [Caldilineaceae bacterium]
MKKYFPPTLYATLRAFARRLLIAWRRWVGPVLPLETAGMALWHYGQYWQDWQRYAAMPGAERLSLQNGYPQLLDRTISTPYDPFYFYQDVWAFQKVRQSAAPRHVDVGSNVRWVGLLTNITTVQFVDIRPLEAQLDNFFSISGSILALPFANNTVTSLSCLHVAEHIGLGRYGDPLDPMGTLKAARELARVLAPGGSLYFSVPVGEPRVCFNAHRIHAPRQIVHYFNELALADFAGITDSGRYMRQASMDDFAHAEYSCGLFHFRKPR